MTNRNVLMLGGGNWGLALATLLDNNGLTVSVWEYFRERVKELTEKKIISFPGLSDREFKLPSSIKIFNELTEITKNQYGTIIFAVSSSAVRDTVRKLKQTGINYKKCGILSVVKGFEPDTLKRISETICKELPEVSKNICVLSGPSFAIEVIQKMPTAVVVAGKNEELAKTIQEIFSNKYFRVYTHSDIVGVEIAGAVKNVLAIACGISDGLGFKYNTKSGLVTRGMREIIKLGAKLGGKIKTFYGLSGLGDLTATCFSQYSRNRLLGEKIGRGTKPETALREIKSVAEGYITTRSAYLIGKKNNLELPIINEVYRVIYENKSPKKAVTDLMVRQLKSEN